ncbi:MAG: cadherin-like domain-containing protein [Bacteroidetes bacterium]|nr:cadherin-like domain-containing protein [Bacteroidota bacterium]
MKWRCKANDTDPENNTQTVTAQTTTTAGKGTLVLNTDGTYTFTPDPSFVGGPVDFAYTTCDNGTPQACATATLHIMVETRKSDFKSRLWCNGSKRTIDRQCEYKRPTNTG